jgi:hypothetical protein
VLTSLIGPLLLRLVLRPARPLADQPSAPAAD